MNKFLFASILILFALASQAQPLAMKSENGVQWQCGGIGADERRALSALEPQANLSVLFVTEKRGGYIADVEIALFEKNARTPLLTLGADGPICLLRVPPGSYRLEAMYRGTTRRQQASVAAAAARPVRVVFAFPGEPWDGIWASAEEKRQARE